MKPKTLGGGVNTDVKEFIYFVFGKLNPTQVTVGVESLTDIDDDENY